MMTGDVYRYSPDDHAVRSASQAVHFFNGDLIHLIVHLNNHTNNMRRGGITNKTHTETSVVSFKNKNMVSYTF